MTTLQNEIEEILEKTCGWECPNGAENDKPSVGALLKLFESRMTEVIGEDKYVPPAYKAARVDDAVKNDLRAEQKIKLAEMLKEE